MIFLSYAAFFFCLEGATLSVLALWLDPKGPLNRIVGLVGFLAAFWGFCLVFELGAERTETSLFFYKLSVLGELAINSALVWLLLETAGTPCRIIALVLIPVGTVAGSIYLQYFANGFPIVDFRLGPWGNVGVPRTNPWRMVAEALYLSLYAFCAFQLKKAGFAAKSRRHGISVASICLGLTVPLVLFLNFMENALALPSLDFTPGIFLIALNFYLVAKYRYLRKELPSLEEGFTDVLRDPAFLLDRYGTVRGVNEAGRNHFLTTGEDPVGKTFAGLLDDSCAFQIVWQAVEERRTQSATSDFMVGLKSFSPHYDRFGDFVGALILLRAQQTPLISPGLSGRESEILRLLVEGESNRSIATQLFLAQGTVKRHTHNILRKTGARDRNALFRMFGSDR